ncbi:MAG: hypothetical protein KF764_29645 [Labilithrix sp.]|nr:hypothetical protein [Labilithrix sp.]
MNRADRQDLRALRDKYERMLSLRTAHERARRDVSFVEPDPRPEMARLAADYPGSLREIDRLPLDVIAARIAALSAAERRPLDAEPWMIAQATFHRFARAALATKRWLAGRKAITPALRSAFTRATARLPHGADARLLASELEAIASPPRGRLMDVVHARVARTLDVTPAEARRLVFDAAPPRAGR